LQMVWMAAGSVSTLPSSMTTLPVRKIMVLGVRSGVGIRGRVGAPGGRRPPPPPACPKAVRAEIESRQAQASRVLMKRPRTTFPNCTPDGMANCQIIIAAASLLSQRTPPVSRASRLGRSLGSDGRSGGLLGRKRGRHPWSFEALSLSWATAQMAIAIPERVHFFLDTIVRHT
jgi:hypothetical protein